MRKRIVRPAIVPVALFVLAVAGLAVRPIEAQGRSGELSVAWAADGKSFVYERNGQAYRYTIAARSAKPIGRDEAQRATDAAPRRTMQPGHTNTPGPARAQQFTVAKSPDGRYEAVYRDRNVWLKDASGEIAITTDGDAKARTKNGSAPWVYGEELDQGTAMWWAPSSKKLAYYRFDESAVPDYYLQIDQTKVQSRMHVEAYPKAGAPNPVVELFVYDLPTRRTVRIDVRDGAPFTNDAIGHYVYDVGWTPDGSEVTLRRANRRQNTMEFAACSPETGKCRTVVRETWPASWVSVLPPMQYLADGKRFIWTSERTGWTNFSLYDLSGKLLATLTRHPFEVADFLVDEAQGVLYYRARDGDNPMKLQLHRVRLDGRGERRLTDSTFAHTVSIAPGGRHFIDVMETHDTPPSTWLRDANGKTIAQLAPPDSSALDPRKRRPVELFSFKAADSVTTLYGMIHFPSNFDSTRKYPVLVSVYAGPGSKGASERFALSSALTERGYLVVSLDSRSASGRGKKFMDVIYQRLGTAEVDDQAAGVKALWKRPYVDRHRVGIFGTSYGGYVSIMALIRHPDVFQASSASSSVTDWRNYDTIYTERYMWMPQENPEGYDRGSAVQQAANVGGRAMLFYGTADDNVHPANTLQLIAAMQAAGKSFDVQVGPDQGHTMLDLNRMFEFFDLYLTGDQPRGTSS